MNLLDYLHNHQTLPIEWDGDWVSAEQDWLEFLALQRGFEERWDTTPSAEIGPLWGRFMMTFRPLDWSYLMGYFERVPATEMPDALRAVVTPTPHADSTVRAVQVLYRTRHNMPVLPWLKMDDLLSTLDVDHSIEVLQYAWNSLKDNTRTAGYVAHMILRWTETLKKTFETVRMDDIPCGGVGPILAFAVGMTNGIPYISETYDIPDEVSFAKERLALASVETLRYLMKGIQRSDMAYENLDGAPWFELFSMHPLLKSPLNVYTGLGIDCTPQDLLQVLSSGDALRPSHLPLLPG